MVELRLDDGTDLTRVADEAREVLGGKSDVERVAPGGSGRTVVVLRAQVPRGSTVIDLATRLRRLPGVTDADISA